MRMLEKLDLTKRLEKGEYKKRLEFLSTKLSSLQRELKEEKIPVIIVFEGLQGGEKGILMNRLIQPLDPRGFFVHSIKGESEEEQMRPFLWRFWTKIPEQGKISLFDRSWYRTVLSDRFDKITPKARLEYAYQEINSFEKQLTDDGTLIIKLFLCLSQEEQKKRLLALLNRKDKVFTVSKQDLKRNKHYDKYLKMSEEALQLTDTQWAPWTIIEGNHREYATIKIMTSVVEYFQRSIEKRKKIEESSVNGLFSKDDLKSSILDQVDLAKSMNKDKYKEKLKTQRENISLLHGRLYSKRIPAVILFEGWDAAGKGGAIKRLTEGMDPRGYQVNPISAPNDWEKSHHYLWRFWEHIPKDGHIAIFDRSWYGRVMVERVEGFCKMEEWMRAYKEINELEKQLVNHGTVLLKFWLHIDKEEQEKRFLERMKNPEKQWKITEEDWRNRENWDLYHQAVDEMLLKTSTAYAPWIVVEGNNKYYARIKVLEQVVLALKKKLGEW